MADSSAKFKVDGDKASPVSNHFDRNGVRKMYVYLENTTVFIFHA
jgi:hypothetical protein